MADRQNLEKRTRASTACENCRARRTKCIVPAKETSCSGCIVNNIQCVFRHSDERKRPTSKAYVNSLLDRITLLEKTILDLGQPLPTSGCSSQGPISFNDAGASNTSPGKPTDAFIPGETAAQPLVKSSIRQAFDTFYNVMGYEDINHALENSPADRDTGTELLEICVLAMGSHLARSTDNELRKQAKIRLDMEFHHRKSFPLVRACSIISDLELAMGDLNSSREYSNKMIEILRNIIEKPAAPIDEASHWELARDLVVSCRLRNHFWSTFRNHPLDFSSIEEMASQSAQQISSLESNHRPLSYREGVGNFGDRFRELTSLVEGILRNFYQPATESSPLRSLLKFDRKLHSWYTKLPSAFKLSADTTIHSTKFFLLHQQYHTALILLHWPFARYNQSAPDLDRTTDEDAITLHRLSRACCSRNASRISNILQEQRQHPSMKLKHFTSLQYATTAAIVLVAAVQFSNIPAERQPLLGNLQSITDSLSELAVTFEPAKALAASLHTLLQKDEVNVAALLNFDSGFRDHIFMSSITSEMFGQSVPPLCDHEPLEEWALTSATHADIAARSSSSAFDGDIFTNDFLSPIGSLEANAGAGSTNSLEDRSESWY